VPNSFVLEPPGATLVGVEILGGRGYPQTLNTHNSASIWPIWMILVSFFSFFDGLSCELICNPKLFVKKLLDPYGFFFTHYTP
jgi:hypothetical protein